jgi:dihydroorotate dehydrogenase electron transfer subunit
VSQTNRPVRVDAEVRSNRHEGGANWRLRLGVQGWPGFEPGQFVMLSPGARSRAERFDPLLPRPMAVFRAAPMDGGADVEVLYKVTGRGTQLLAEARVRERVGVVGPLGQPFPLPSRRQRAVLVGGGTGVASLFELAARVSRSTRVEVLLGARRIEDVMGLRDFQELGVNVSVSTEDGSSGRRGLVTELLENALSRAEASIVYACGPTAMMQRCAELCAARGQRCLVSLENTMACGFGVCLGCAVPRATGGTTLVCCDGPIFDAGAIAWPAVP